MAFSLVRDGSFQHGAVNLYQRLRSPLHPAVFTFEDMHWQGLLRRPQLQPDQEARWNVEVLRYRMAQHRRTLLQREQYKIQRPLPHETAVLMCADLALSKFIRRIIPTDDQPLGAQIYHEPATVSSAAAHNVILSNAKMQGRPFNVSYMLPPHSWHHDSAQGLYISVAQSPSVTPEQLTRMQEYALAPVPQPGEIRVQPYLGHAYMHAFMRDTISYQVVH